MLCRCQYSYLYLADLVLIVIAMLVDNETYETIRLRGDLLSTIDGGLESRCYGG